MAKATKTTSRFADDSQVLKASKAIVRYIHAHGLGAGAKLPSQTEFRATIRFSNDTLSSAMKFLSGAGVLVRKFGSGTTVKDPDAIVRGLWTVGVATVPRDVLSDVPFFAQELGFVQAHLSEAGCRCRLYYPPANQHVSYPAVFPEFLHLMEDFAAGELDAVIALPDVDLATWPKRFPPPMVMGTRTRNDAPLGALIDQRSMVRQAVQVLAGQGCRRLAVVSLGAPHPGFQNCRNGFTEGLAAAGLPENAGEVIADHFEPKGSLRQRGRLSAAHLLARKPEQRPDGIIITDDWLAMGLTAILRETGGYAPKIVIQCNRQAPLTFALPATRFEVDVDALAARGVGLVVARLKNPLSVQPETVWLCPCLATDGH